MSKILILLLISLLQLFIFPIQAFASEDCSADTSGSITYEPKLFPPPAGVLTLNFTINNPNAHNNLKGKSVRLHYILPGRPGVGDYNTPEVTIPTDKNTFSIPLTGDSKMTSPGENEAVLDLVVGTTVLGNNRHEEYCKGIRYTVGDPNICAIDPSLRTQIPPDTKLTIKFSGKPGTKYDIRDNNLAPYLASALTGEDGQGEFRDLLIKGVIGDQKILFLAIPTPGRNDSITYCSSKPITISNSAPTPTAPPPGLVATVGPGVTPQAPTCITNPGSCTKGGGIPCGDGIQTAIGCIHTNLSTLVSDIFKFLVGISGGIAFIMMILGSIQMLTSQGNPQSVQAGRERFTSALIGLLFIVFSVLLLQIIGADILKLPEFKQ